MDALNTLVKLFQDGAVLTNEELNLIVSYINLIVEYINNNIKPAIENGILGKNGRDGVDGRNGRDGIEGISSLNAFVGAVDATDALSKFNNNRNQTTYPPDGFFIGSNVSLLGSELLFMTSARRRGENDWLYGSDGYIWSVPVLLGSNTTSTTGVDSDTINYVYCRTKRNVDAESFFPSNELLQKRIINYVELSPNNGIKIIGLVETTINNMPQASVDDINGVWTDHPYGIDENLPHEWMAGFKKDSNDEWEYYFGPVMISNYGFNGLDGDGFEYIFKGFSSEKTSWPNDDTYPPNWINNHLNDFLNDDYLGPNNDWLDDAIGTDDTYNKFIYVCTRKKYVDDGETEATWHTFSEPKLWTLYVKSGEQGPEGRKGSHTQFIFKTTSADLSVASNYTELNTSVEALPSGWNITSTAPSSSSEIVWGSHRLILYNTSNVPQYGDWQPPYKVSGSEGPSGGRYEFRYTNFTPTTNHETPTKPTENTNGIGTYGSGADAATWAANSSTPDFVNGEYTYMSQCYCTSDNTYGEWSNVLRITGDKGEQGEDGDSIEFIYRRFKTKQTFGSTNLNPLFWEASQTPDYLGEAYNTTASDSPNNKWTDNPRGVNETYMYEYVASREFKYLTSEATTKTWGKFGPAVIWSKWGEKGQDGDGYEYIYKAFPTELTFSTNNNNPAYWSAVQLNGYYGPEGYEWENDPVGISTTNKYEYVSIRKRTNETWGTYSTPSLWSNYTTAEGSSTPTVVYLLVATVSEIRYGRNHAGVATWNPSTFDIQLFKYEGTTFSQLNDLPSLYSLKRTIYGENISSNTANIKSLGSINSSDVASYYSNGDTIIGDRVKFEVLDENHNTVAVLNLSIVREYLRMLIPMGIYTDKKYVRTDTTVPLVLGSDDTYYYLDADTNRVNDSNIAPTDHDQTVWAAATEYEVILTKALFADFAKLGSFVVYGNYFFSQYGELRRYNDTSIIVNETNYSTLYVSGSDEKVPYGYFDPNDPIASNLDSNHPTKFMPAKIINALTGEEWMAGGKVYIDVNGKVTMNDIYVKNGVMSHKVKTLHRGYGNQQNILEYYMYLWNNENTDNEYYYPLDLSLTCDHLFIVGDGSNNRKITIHLPPAHYFIGQRIIITNNTINYISDSINIMLDYYYYINSNKIIVLTNKEFMDGGKYYSEEEDEGVPFIPLNNIIQEGHYMASGIWSPRSGGESADNDYIYMSCNVDNLFNINDYEWVEFTAVEGILKNSSAYTTNGKDEELNFVLKFNAIWMLSRWEKKLEELN